MANYYGMSYKGYSYFAEWEVEADGSNKKLWHYIKDPEGNVSDASVGGSYSFPSTEEVHNYIDKLLNES
jgi:hypothetical protein